jgi:hypothetical protein
LGTIKTPQSYAYHFQPSSLSDKKMPNLFQPGLPSLCAHSTLDLQIITDCNCVSVSLHELKDTRVVHENGKMDCRIFEQKKGATLCE